MNPSRLPALGFLAALLTLAFFCIGAAPIPLTAIVCYPAALITALLAALLGFMGLRRAGDMHSRWMSIAAIAIGLLVTIGVICTTALTLSLIASGADYFWKNSPQWQWPRLDWPF